MLRVKRVGHVGITVPDVPLAVDFYQKALGLEVTERSDGAAFLRCNEEHHCIALYPGESNRLHHLGLEVEDEEALEQARQELPSRDISIEAKNYDEPGHGPSVLCRDADGHLVELYTGMETLAERLGTLSYRPTKLGHINFFTPDVPKAVEFYTDVLGFRRSDTMGTSGAWIHCNPDHHGIAFIQAPATIVHHYAFEVADWNAMKDFSDNLYQNGDRILYGVSRHGPGENLFLYIGDASGNVIEIFAEVQQITDEENYEPKDWVVAPQTIDVWRALPPELEYMQGRGRLFNDWSKGSNVIGSGWKVEEIAGHEMLDPAAEIKTPTPDNQEFQIDIPKFTMGFQSPLDHAKAMVYTDLVFPTHRGFSASVDMAVRTHNTESNPFGADPDDPRLANGSIALRDDATGMVINFEVSNRRVLALRELLVVDTPGGNASVKPMAELHLTDVEIEPGSWHHYEIRYNRGVDAFMKPGPDLCEWFVDNELVHSIEWVATVDPPAAPVIKSAGFTVGMAIFTLLDDLPDGRGGTISGLDPNYENTTFGQGATVTWKNLEVSTVQL